MKFLRTFVSLFLVLFSRISVNAQNGYLYVHQRALSEEISPDYNFNLTGPSTNLSFTLNDKPDNLTMYDLGATLNGALYAVAGLPGANNLYYYAPGSTIWEPIPAVIAKRVDGGINDAAYISAAGDINIYKRSNGSIINLGNDANASDIAYLDRSSGGVVFYRKAGTGQVYWHNASAGGPWTLVPAVNADHIDADTVQNKLFYINSTGVYSCLANGTGQINYGLPSAATFENADLAITGDGNIYVTLDVITYRWTGGTTWVREPISLNQNIVTGGPQGQVWCASSLYSQIGIQVRQPNGNWRDDERIRTGVNNNFNIIPLAPGNYTLTQTAVSNWSLHKILVDDPTNNSSATTASKTATLNIAAGEFVHVIFQNGLVQPTQDAAVCSDLFLETFGTWDGTQPKLTGATSYHYSVWPIPDFFDGFYGTTNNSDVIPGGSRGFFDHTVGDATGRFAFFNGSYQQDDFYRKRFTNLNIGTEYNLSAWLINAYRNIGEESIANVRFSVFDTSGNLLISTTSGEITPYAVWMQTSLQFTATTTTVDVVLSNNAGGVSGNNVGIDDISFKPLTDKGDAPASYGTAGTCSAVSTLIRLGNTVDAEDNAYPTDAADGDDAHGTDDEDGVPVMLPVTNNGNIPQNISSYSFTSSYLNNTASPVYIGAWIDWNINGIFEPGEGQVVTVNPTGAAPGSSTFTWTNVTLSGTAGKSNTYARIRISGAPITTSMASGALRDGETEDYKVPFSVILPLRLLSFDARKESTGAGLRWQVAEELNQSHYIIQRSTDGSHFYDIGSVTANGGPMYSFFDQQPAKGINYYRLKMIAADGAATYSTIKLLSFNSNAGITLSPNPVKDKAVISGLHGQSRVAILDMQGKLVRVYTTIETQLTIDLESISSGIYQAAIYNADNADKPVRVIKLVHY